MQRKANYFMERRKQRLRDIMTIIEVSKKIGKEKLIGRIAVQTGLNSKTVREHITDLINGEYITEKDGILSIKK